MEKLCWTAIFVASLCAVASGADRIETIDARQFAGPVVSVTKNAVVFGRSGASQQLPRSDVASVVLAQAGQLMQRNGQAVIVTAGGGQLAAADINVADGKVSFASGLLGRVSWPMGRISRILLPGGATSPAQVLAELERLAPAGQDLDVLLVRRSDGNLAAVAGVLEKVDAEAVRFRWKGKARAAGRDSVLAVRLAGAAGESPSPGGVLCGRDGSRIGFSTLSMDSRSVTVELLPGRRQQIPRECVAAIHFVSDRVTALSALKPAVVTEYGFFDQPFGHRVDRAVGGGALRLGGKTYDSGLGLHSFCELTWRLDGPYSSLVAVVGIDDAVRPRGAAMLTFLGDGKPLAAPLHLTGKDPPQTLRLGLTGVRELTVRVEFGPDGLDVGDHVDLAGARLIR